MGFGIFSFGLKDSTVRSWTARIKSPNAHIDGRWVACGSLNDYHYYSLVRIP